MHHILGMCSYRILSVFSQDISDSKRRKAAGPGPLHCAGILGQAFSHGGLQVWPEILHSCYFLWSTACLPLQRRPGSIRYREVPHAKQVQPGKLAYDII